MNPGLTCKICGDAIVAPDLCTSCLAMDRQIQHLIETRSGSVRKYLTQKLQEATIREEGKLVSENRGFVFERRKRQILFSPLRRKNDHKLSWTHVPDRRVRNESHPQDKRKTDKTNTTG